VNEDAKKWIWWAIPIAVVVAIGAALYYGYKQKQPQPSAQVEQTPQETPVEPAIKHPLPEDEAQQEPLPTLEESDASVHESLTNTFGERLDQFLVSKNLIRHTVVTIDNLPRKKTAVQMWPLKPMPGELIVKSSDTEITLDETNFARYAPLIGLLQKADTQQVAALYRRYYPLLQQAYVDLGYPDGYFNDRLVEVIDHLLETPEVQGPIKLTQPSVHYEYADPSLESRSAGQKLLIRMGPANAAAVKQKLREFRAAIAKPASPPG